MAKDWISGAIEHPGALRHAASQAHLVSGDRPLTGAALTKLEHSKSPITRKRAALAKTLKAMHHK